MLKVTEEVDFETLYTNSWGQAREVLREIDEEGMSEELMDFLEDLYPDGIDRIELNDRIAYDWEWLYKNIGMPMDKEEED
nr:MAG TPA: hypothetical protein [Caudoviricetes sp.]